ncbi:hypothetical protein GCM10027415_26140 [Humibacter ginsengisoli]
MVREQVPRVAGDGHQAHRHRERGEDDRGEGIPALPGEPSVVHHEPELLAEQPHERHVGNPEQLVAEPEAARAKEGNVPHSDDDPIPEQVDRDGAAEQKHERQPRIALMPADHHRRKSLHHHVCGEKPQR